MTVLAVDRLPEHAPEGQATGWVAHVVLEDGSVVTHPVSAFDRSAGTCTLTPDLRSTPLTGALCVLSSASAPSTLWRVLSVHETDGLALDFTARQYHPGRYAAVETDLTLNPLESDRLHGQVPAPAAVTLHKRLYEDGSGTRSALVIGVEDPAGGRDARVAGIDYRLRRTTGEDTDYRPVAFTEAGLAEILDVRPGTYRARARYLADNGALRSPWTESADGTILTLSLSADMRTSDVIDGVAVSAESPYAAVPVALIVAGATAGTASDRPGSARKFSAVLDATASTEVYYWRSEDGETLYLQNDTAGNDTPPALRLYSLVGIGNPGV